MSKTGCKFLKLVDRATSSHPSGQLGRQPSRNALVQGATLMPSSSSLQKRPGVGVRHSTKFVPTFAYDVNCLQADGMRAFPDLFVSTSRAMCRTEMLQGKQDRQNEYEELRWRKCIRIVNSGMVICSAIEL